MAKRSTKTRRQARQQEQKQQQMRRFGIGIAALVLLVAVVFFLTQGSRTVVGFPDIHGISFTGDGAQLRVATHTGLVAYQAGNWSKPDLPVNDYMGYSGTEDGFFSSGHPGIGSNLVNPLGLVRSQDHGKNVNTISFAGETDFHVMGASYYGNIVYVLNPSANSTLSAGMHYSADGGQTWGRSVADGLTSTPIQIAVHPTQASTVAVVTQQGLFLSKDFGASFERVGDAGLFTAVAFDPNGERLIFGYDTLLSYDLASETITSLGEGPAIDADQAILYIAINPETNAMAVATSDRDLFYSSDNGQAWKQIGADGESL